jgi:hypothetical protein
MAITTTKRTYRVPRCVQPQQIEALRGGDPMLYEALKALANCQSIEVVTEVGGEGGGGTPEILLIANTHDADKEITLPDPATFTDPKTIVSVKNWNGGVHELHILPGAGGTIDGIADGIRTKTNNQGYRFRYAVTPEYESNYGWVCIQTVFGGDTVGTIAGAPPPGTPGIQLCDADLPDWILDPTLAAAYEVLSAASGTYTKPVGPYFYIACVGFGSGGGGGDGAANNSGDYTGGGAGGGAGARKIQIWPYDEFPDSVAYTIHQGGLGAPGRTCPPDTSGDGAAGSDGGPAYLGDIGDPLFFVGGGKAGTGGVMVSVTSTGGQGGSWTQDGTRLGTNVNGTGGDGAGSMRNTGDGFYGTPQGTLSGNAECGGGSGAGAGEGWLDHGGAPSGGSSLHGAAGGGLGGSALVAPLDLTPATAGGSTGTSNGGGADPGTSGLPGSGDGAHATPGTGLNGGPGGGGGGAMFTPDASGRGGNGGIPGGGGGGGGAVFGGGTKSTGGGGDGARGELRMYAI